MAKPFFLIQWGFIVMNFDFIAEQCLIEKTNRVPYWINRLKQFESAIELDDFLHDTIFLGLKIIGRGNYSLVAMGMGGKDYVLKYSAPGVNNDPCAEFMYDVWQTGVWKSNPLFPKIEPDHFIVYDDGTYAVFLEYLDLFSTDPGGDIYKALKLMSLPLLPRQKLKNYRPGIMQLAVFQQAYEECMSNDPHKPYTDAVCLAFRFNKAHLIEYMKFCSDYVSGKVYIDLHSGNIGKRKNGQMVLFDPLGHVVNLNQPEENPPA